MELKRSHSVTFFKLTKRMLDVGNEPYQLRSNAQLAAEIRRFRPEPVAHLSNKQLVWTITRTRNASYDFGVEDPTVIKNWIMVDALLMPAFFAAPGVRKHFQNAFGDSDTKARDILQQIKILFCERGYSTLIWW